MKNCNRSCLTCGGPVFLNNETTRTLMCRLCASEESPLAIPLYCRGCCVKDKKCPNCGSHVEDELGTRGRRIT